MSPKLRRKKKRLVRWLLLASVLVLALPCLLFLAQEPILRRFVIPRVEQALGDALGLSVRLSGATIDLPGEVRLVGFSATGANPTTGVRSASFETVVMELSPWRWLRGRGEWIASVRVEKPRIELDLSHEPVLPMLPGGRRDAGAKPKGAGGDLVLPPIDVRGAEVRLITKVDTLDLHGVDATLDGRSVRLRVASAGGDWSPPRVEALQLPLEVDARFVGSDEPWKEIRLDRLAMAGREYAHDFHVDLSDASSIQLSGDLPGWGLKLTQGSVATRGADPPLLDLTFLADGASLKPIVSLFTAWPCPEALATGRFRLVLPIGKEADWRVETDLELAHVVWKEEDLRADLVRAVGRRDGDRLVLEGDVLAAGLAWRGSPIVDVTGRFRRETVAGGRGFEIAIDDAVLHRGNAEADVFGTIAEDGLSVDHGALRSKRLPLAELARAGVLPAGLTASDADVDLEASFRGALLEPSTWDATGSVRGRVMQERRDSAVLELSLDARLGSCQLRFDHGALRWCEDAVIFAGSAGLPASGDPVLVAFDRLEGQVLGVELAAIELPAVEVRDGRLRLEPSVLRALGGTLTAAASGSLSGETSAFLSAEGIDLSWFSGPLPALAPAGLLSLDAELHSEGVDGGSAPGLEVEALLRRGAATLAGERVEGIDGRLRAEATADTLEVRGVQLARGRDRVNLAVTVPVSWDPLPVPLAGEEFDVKLDADLADVGSVSALKRGFRELAGRVSVSGDARGRVPEGLRGSWGPLDFSALVKVGGGTIKRFEDVPPITDLEGEVRISNGTVAVEALAGKMHDAYFTVTGGVETSLPWSPEGFGVRSVDLKLLSTGALLARRPNLRVRGDLDLRWHGPWEASRLDGDVVITRAYYLEDVSLAPTRGARLPLKLFSLAEPPLDALRLNLKVRSDRGIIIRNNVVSTRASAQLLLGGTGLEPVLSGTVSTDEGTVRFADTSLKLRNSFIELLPDDPLNPRLQIVIGETIRGYAVTLSITGSLEQPEVLLDSSPPLEREKVLVLITTGLTLEEIEERGVSRVAAVKAAKYVGLRLARYLSKGDPTDKSFFDRISLETDSAKYVGQEDPIRVELRLIESLIRRNDELFLQGERDAYGDYNFNFGLRFELE